MNELYNNIDKMIEGMMKFQQVKFTSSEFRYYSESVGPVSNSSVQFDKGILDFYQLLDFVNIQWFLKENSTVKVIDPDSEIVSGEVNIFPLKQIVEIIEKQDSPKTVDPYHTLDDARYAGLKNFIPFDVKSGGGAVGFISKENVVKDSLYLVSDDGEKFLTPLNTACNNYFQKGIEMLFFSGWQQAVFLHDEQKLKTINERIPQIVKL